MVDVRMLLALYDRTREWFVVIPPFLCPATFIVDAPFGRFSPSNKSIFTVDGIRSWIGMELVSLLFFVNAYLRSPLSPTSTLALTSLTRFLPNAPPLSLTHPPTLIAAAFVTHYLNRALISPLRTPSRSKSHLLVVSSAVFFNVVNGSLMGAYLSSPAAQAFLHDAFTRPTFWLGLGLWAAGFAGNIVHDEILLNIRRNTKNGPSQDDDANNGKDKNNAPKQEHYAIPHGLLYRFISYPNYFCEWSEWLGFALAASPAPSCASLGAFVATVTPPWLFFFNEVWLMLPRAYKGHRWYLARFPDYPKERTAVIPFLF
ncbi:3-oxo-5-alpha-steroid 4-dehydrogenase-domain-containing protein [Ganoderma leucocontextum]|nr:3-oxo-5-alpha-steroid 4-dehydrogenase-domain-containing protein [Ganoderma leucocontextum]